MSLKGKIEGANDSGEMRAVSPSSAANYFYIGRRLMLIFAVLIALILGGNGLVVWQFYIARARTDRLTGANHQMIVILHLQVTLLSFHQQLDDLARSKDARRMMADSGPLLKALDEQIQQTRTALLNLPADAPAEPAFWPTLETIEVTLPAQLKAITELGQSGDWEAVQLRLASALKPIETQTAVLVESIDRQAGEELSQAVAEMSTVQRRILVIVPATAISTFIIAALFGWSIARRIIELRLEERIRERTRLARDLHDTLLQSFHGLMLRFQAVSKLLPEGKAKDQLEKALERGDQAIAEGRSAVYELRSSTTTTNELSEALSAVGAELSREDSAEFGLVVEGEPRDLHPMIRDELYRISREALRNAFKHAGARRIEVEMSYGERVFRIRIRDDGKGIPPDILEHGRPGHYGLSGLRERARQIGADLTVWSRAGSGTEIDLSLTGSITYGTPAGRSRRRIFGRKVGDT